MPEARFRELRNFVKPWEWSPTETFRRGAELLLLVYPNPPLSEKTE
jgi:hypothetical protein